MRRKEIMAAALLLAVATGCAAKKRAVTEGIRPGPEMHRQALEQLEQGKAVQAASTLERIQFTAENREELEPLVRLTRADATFFQWHDLAWIDARGLYLEFVTLYADHPRADYAQFQAGMCSLYQVSHPSKDQTQTRRAIADLREVERRFPGSRYVPAARAMIERAEASLAEHEFQVGRFYLKRKAYVAATQRFRNILEAYPHFAELDKVYFHLGQALLRSDNDAEGKIYLDKLVTDYPQGRWVEEAKKELSKSDPVTLDVEVQGSP